jgi:uncharacterized Zn finger protein
MAPSSVESKGKRIFEEGKVVKEVDTDRRMHFRVVGDTEEHHVIFDKSKKEWGCDCAYSVLKRRECSHIVAAKLSSTE